MLGFPLPGLAGCLWSHQTMVGEQTQLCCPWLCAASPGAAWHPTWHLPGRAEPGRGPHELLPLLQQPTCSLLCWNISRSLGSLLSGCQGWLLIPLFRVFPEQEEKRTAYAHLGSQEGWGSVPAAAGVTLVLLSFHSHVRRCAHPWASPHGQVVSLPPLCSQQHGRGQGRGAGGGTPSSPGSPSAGSAPQQGWEHLKAQALPSRSQWGFWDMGALAVWKFVGLRTHI